MVALVLVGCGWELYKAIGPAEGGSLLGLPLPKTTDRAMPHTWDMAQRLGEPENRGGDTPIWVSVAGYAC